MKLEFSWNFHFRTLASLPESFLTGGYSRANALFRKRSCRDKALAVNSHQLPGLNFDTLGSEWIKHRPCVSINTVCWFILLINDTLNKEGGWCVRCFSHSDQWTGWFEERFPALQIQQSTACPVRSGECQVSCTWYVKCHCYTVK